MADSYWSNSWKQVDIDRLKQYVDGFDDKKDPLIEHIRVQQVRTVCDAGCGCGVFAAKLAENGFDVSGFDVAEHAVEIAEKLLERVSLKADLRTADIRSTGYEDGRFDCAIARDVVDHMRKRDAVLAVGELCRIVRPGGIVLLTLDRSDEEYENEKHIVSDDGDYIFTDGKWQGMVFHPYSEEEIKQLLPDSVKWQIEDGKDGMVVRLITRGK